MVPTTVEEATVALDSLYSGASENKLRGVNFTPRDDASFASVGGTWIDLNADCGEGFDDTA